MISLAVFDDQDKPIGPEWAGEHNFAIERRDQPRTRPRLDREATMRLAAVARLTKAQENSTVHGRHDGALAERARRGRRRRQACCDLWVARRRGCFALGAAALGVELL